MKKNNKIKSLCVIMAMLFSGIAAQAQIENSVYLNGSLPTGQMNASITRPAGQSLLGKSNIGKSASLGLGMGYRACYHFDIGFGEVSPFFNADLQWNRLTNDLRDEYITNGASIPNYFNIPLMIGVNYRYALTDIIKVFGEFAVGDDFFMITSEGWSENNIEGRYKYNVKSAMAWQIGAGSYFGSHVSVGLHYYGLGNHAITYNDKSTGALALVDKTVEPRRIGSLVLRIGFHF